MAEGKRDREHVSGDDNLDGQRDREHASGDDDSFKKRYGYDEPAWPESLSRLDKAAREAMHANLDLLIREDHWGSAMDAEDNGGFLLVGKDEVLLFARQASGSVYGLLVGDVLPEDTESCPVVRIDSEGSAAKCAGNLKDFCRIVCALTVHVSDVVCYAGSSAIGEEDPIGQELDKKISSVKELVSKWKQRADEGELSSEQLMHLRRSFGISDEALWTVADAIDRVFAVDFAQPKFRPKNDW